MIRPLIMLLLLTLSGRASAQTTYDELAAQIAAEQSQRAAEAARRAQEPPNIPAEICFATQLVRDHAKSHHGIRGPLRFGSVYNPYNGRTSLTVDYETGTHDLCKLSFNAIWETQCLNKITQSGNAGAIFSSYYIGERMPKWSKLCGT